jgi:hypothetical protein
MTIVLDLSAEEETLLTEQARRAGLAPADYLRRYIAEQGMEFKFDPRYSSEWTDEDLRDASLASLNKLVAELSEEGADA